MIGIAIDILGRALRDQPVTSIHTNTVATKNQLDNFTIFPKKVNFGHNKLAVFLVEPLQKDDLIRVKIEKSGDIFEIPNIKRRNPFTLQLTIPGNSCLSSYLHFMLNLYIFLFRKLLRNVFYDTNKGREKWM